MVRASLRLHNPAKTASLGTETKDVFAKAYN